MRRQRKAKILATLGPASSSKEMIRELFRAGADVFRLNFSHGSHDDHRERYDTIREIEAELDRPIGILADMQGPKLRIGNLKGGEVTLKAGQRYRLDLDETPGDDKRAPLLHPEIFAAISAGTSLLIDDGKLRLEVQDCTHDHAETRVVTGGVLRDHKGVNLPGVILPISPITEKDRVDLEFALQLGVDWIALSFVQRPDDVAETHLRSAIAADQHRCAIRPSCLASHHSAGFQVCRMNFIGRNPSAGSARQSRSGNSAGAGFFSPVPSASSPVRTIWMTG